MADNDELNQILTAASSSPEMIYVKIYHETLNALNIAIVKYKLIADTASDVGARAAASSRYLQALREKHLVEELYYAWETGSGAPIKAPTQAMLDKTLELSRELAAINASEQRMTAIIDLFTNVATAFNSIHGQAVPAAPETAALA